MLRSSVWIEIRTSGRICCLVVTFQFINLLIFCHAVCAEAFNPDEDEEDKEPWVNCVLNPKHPVLQFSWNFPNSSVALNLKHTLRRVV